MDEISGRTPYPLYDLGAGRIKRGPSSMARPDPSAPRKWVKTAEKDLEYSDTEGPYIIVLYTTTGTPSEFRIAFWPTFNWNGGTLPGHTGSTIPAWMIYAGHTEEFMGVQSNQIINIWVSPIPVLAYGSSTHTATYSSWEWYDLNAGQNPYEVELTLSDSVKTDDYTKYVFVDPKGTEFFTAPWDVDFKKICLSLDIAASGAFMNIVLKPANSSAVIPGEGRIGQIALMNISSTENAVSDYTFSGQREYDMTTARLQQQQNYQSGIIGSAEQAMSGALGGAIAGRGAGAIAGAGIGLATGLITAKVNYELQGYYDAKSQQAYDKLMSNQVNAALVSGGGTGWRALIGKWKMISLSRDSESSGELSDEQSELGYITDSYKTDCSTVITTGGGLRIEGLEVKGDIPPEGRVYIAALFARGVHLDLIQ